MGIIKKKRRIFLLYSLFFISIFSLTACALTERQETDSTNTKTDVLEEWKGKLPKDMPERLDLELKNGSIKVDGFLEVSKELSDWKAEELILKRHLFQETECLDDLLELLGNPKVLKRRQWTSDETLEDGITLKVDNADLKGEDTFVQARTSHFMATFSQKGIMSVEERFIMNPQGLYDGAEKNKDLAFGNYEKVCLEIEKFLKKQKIDNLLNPMVYSFSPELLQKVADKNYQEYMSVGDEERAENYKVTLGAEDGVYLIRYMQGYKGVPYSYMPLVGSDVDGHGSVGTNMCVKYGKQGIQYLSGGEFFDVEQAEEEKEILSLYDILNKVSEYFDSNENNKVTIKEIGLCYLPIIKDSAKLEFTGVPVWYLVYGEGVAAKTGTAREIITFDARTGEIYG